MSRCIQLAKNGLGTTYPNPLVGAVIVKDDLIIGEGWHYKAGEPHAEVNAIRSITNKTLLEGATVYVSLEPCSHFGKTPPCSSLIIEKGIKKVVIGCLDPNPKVAGKGVAQLEEAGCEVITGILEKDCIELNKRFFAFHNLKRPYIILKWAQTQDGFIAPAKRDVKEPVWISNNYSKQWAHKLRANEQAILVGTQTVLDDNPSLNTRLWKGTSPLRVVLDRYGKISTDFNVLDGSIPTMVISESEKEASENISFEAIDFNSNVARQISDVLFKTGMQSFIVEGGRKMLQTFIDENLWDEAFVITGNKNFESGVPAPQFSGELISEELYKTDSIKHYTLAE